MITDLTRYGFRVEARTPAMENDAELSPFKSIGLEATRMMRPDGTSAVEVKMSFGHAEVVFDHQFNEIECYIFTKDFHLPAYAEFKLSDLGVKETAHYLKTLSSWPMKFEAEGYKFDRTSPQSFTGSSGHKKIYLSIYQNENDKKVFVSRVGKGRAINDDFELGTTIGLKELKKAVADLVKEEK
jgi:hypothetical protein